MVAIITGITTAIVGGIFALIGVFLKKSIIEKIEELSIKVTTFKEEMLKDYVRKDDFKDHIDKNDTSHKEIWKDMNSLREKVAQIK